MKPFAIAVIASLCFVGVAHAQMSSEDRAAFADAGIAAVHAGLGLKADQEKLWPAVETAIRGFSKASHERAAERKKAKEERQKAKTPADLVARLRQRAEDGAASAADLKKVAEAMEPLYKALDDGQKKRMSKLMREQRVLGNVLRGRGDRDRGAKDHGAKEHGSKDSGAKDRSDKDSGDKDGGDD